MFASETGWVFDEIEYSDNEVAEQKLRLNGFKRCDEDEKFIELFSVPETLEKHTEKPIYSSGKFWKS